MWVFVTLKIKRTTKKVAEFLEFLQFSLKIYLEMKHFQIESINSPQLPTLLIELCRRYLFL